MASHFGNGWRLEKAGDIDLDLHDLVHAGENMRDRERVAAQREEVIVDTDLRDLEDFRPAFGQHFFKGCSWRDESLWPVDAAPEPQLRRQADALDFACRAFR